MRMDLCSFIDKHITGNEALPALPWQSGAHVPKQSLQPEEQQESLYFLSKIF